MAKLTGPKSCRSQNASSVNRGEPALLTSRVRDIEASGRRRMFRDTRTETGHALRPSRFS